MIIVVRALEPIPTIMLLVVMLLAIISATDPNSDGIAHNYLRRAAA